MPSCNFLTRKDTEARAKLSQLQRSLAREDCYATKHRGARGSAVAAVRERRQKEVSFVASWGNFSHLQRNPKGSAMRENAVATPLSSSFPSSIVVDVACGEAATIAIDDEGRAVAHCDRKTKQIKGMRVSQAAVNAKSVFLVSAQKQLVQIDMNALEKRRVLPLPAEAAVVACGENHCLGATRCGALFAWGDAKGGQLGLGDDVKKRRHKPCRVKLGSREAEDDDSLKVSNTRGSISCGPHHSAAVTRDGSLWTWGWSEHHRLGRPVSRQLPENEQSHFDQDEEEDGCASGTPQKVFLGDDSHAAARFRSVACGSCHTLALTHEGEVYGCGWNEFGQACGRVQFFSSSSSSSEPQQHASSNVSRLTRVCFNKSQTTDEPPERAVSIAAGFAHSLALDTKGVAWAWGFGEDGQLGAGSEESSYVPVQVVGKTDRMRLDEDDDECRRPFAFASIAASGCHSVAVATTCKDPTSLDRVIDERRRSISDRTDGAIRIQSCVRRACVCLQHKRHRSKNARLLAATREAVESGDITSLQTETTEFAPIWPHDATLKTATEVLRRLDARQALAACTCAAVAASTHEISLSRRVSFLDSTIASIRAVPDKDVDAAAVLSSESPSWGEHFEPLLHAIEIRNRMRDEERNQAALKISKLERSRQSRKRARVAINAGRRIVSFLRRIVLVKSAVALLQALKRQRKLEEKSASSICLFMKRLCAHKRQRAAEEEAALVIQNHMRKIAAEAKRRTLKRQARRRREEERKRRQRLREEQELVRIAKTKKALEERKRRAVVDAREAREAARNAALYLHSLRKRDASLAAAASKTAAKVLLKAKRDRMRDRRAQASADRAHAERQQRKRVDKVFPDIVPKKKPELPEVHEGPEDYDDSFVAFDEDTKTARKESTARLPRGRYRL